MSLLYLFVYLCFGVFLAAVFVRALKIARLPLHLRWELYPVAHEPKRARYGGSYLEESEWWTKPRKASKLGELKVMVPEILLLAGVRHSNRSQWIRTFPFHFGLYLLVALTVLLVLGGLLGAEARGGLLGTLIPILGYAGLGLALVGTLALLSRRLLDPDYREYTNPPDFLNLGLFVLVLGVGLLAQIAADADFSRMRAFFVGLFSWRTVDLAPIQVFEVVLFALLAAYVPLTHMSHFFTKWFMYHDIRWSDEPMNERIGREAGRALQMRPTWSAPHIGADGQKNWVDLATSDVPEKKD